MGIDERVFKSKVLLKITDFTKEKVDGKENLKLVKERFETVSGRELWFAVNGRKMNVEIVTARPEKFQFGTIYVLLGGKRAWIFNLIEEEKEEVV